MASRSRTRRLWVLSIAGGAALLVAGGFAASWPLLLARYRCQRLEQASTYDEAKPWLDLLAASAAAAGEPSASGEALLSSLGGSRPRLTCWFFHGLVENALPAGIVQSFARRVKGDDALLALWSHYVRWVQGGGIWAYLSGLSGPVLETAVDSFPCFTPVNSLPGDKGASPQVITVAFSATGGLLFTRSVHAPVKQLEALALAWFLGMTPLPSLDENVEAQLAAWLAGAKPFLRHLVYDEALGRCKRETEFDPLPTLTPFSEQGLPVPPAPLPGWTGPPPPPPSGGAGLSPVVPGLVFPPAGGR